MGISGEELIEYKKRALKVAEEAFSEWDNVYSWGLMDTKGSIIWSDSPQCYAGMRGKKFTVFVATPVYQNHTNLTPLQKILFNWVANESPFAEAIVTKDAEEIPITGIVYDATVCWNVLWPSMLYARMVFENIRYFSLKEINPEIPIWFQFFVGFQVTDITGTVTPSYHGYGFDTSIFSLKKYDWDCEIKKNEVYPYETSMSDSEVFSQDMWRDGRRSVVTRHRTKSYVREMYTMKDFLRKHSPKTIEEFVSDLWEDKESWW